VVDAMEAVGVAACYYGALQFFDHLSVAGGIQVVHQIANRVFADAVTVGVVEQRHGGAVHRLQAVLEIVSGMIDLGAAPLVLLAPRGSPGSDLPFSLRL
jgi:hypothetical protein